jgi:hypothetical protein
MSQNIIPATLNYTGVMTLERRYVGDYGQRIVFDEEMPTSYEVDFSKSRTNGSSVTMIGDETGVEVPDQCFATDGDVFVFLYIVEDNGGRTRKVYRIPVTSRSDRTDETPTPVQQSAVDQAISALNTAVAKTAQDVIFADQSAQDASEDAGRAEQAARTASAKADAITGLTAQATTLPDGSSAKANYNPETGVMSFGIPKGDKGDEYVLTAQDKQDIADIVDVPTKVHHPRISSLNNAKIMDGEIVEVSEIPEYVDDPSKYSEYGITEVGWYVFVRITTKGFDTVSGQTMVDGADGCIVNVGESHVDVAIRFEVASTSKTVTITWKTDDTEVFVFKAVDLAVRNLDYRTTFYVYDITPYRTWSYALTADTKFADGKNYYILSDGEYVLAEVTSGEAIPADTYYNHSKLRFEGMARNVTYNLQEVVDCPIEIVLPEIPKNGYGAWFDIQMRYDGTHSCTLLPPEGVKIGTAQTQSQTKGVNIFELQYTDAGDVKMWTLLNTHSNIPS